MKRYESLDWLRGLMALSIMLYHLVYWEIAPIESGVLLGNLGVYGVSIFFVLSGLSMGIAYNGYIKDINTLFNFFFRRLFRLLPLLWVCIFIITVLDFNNPIDWYTIFLNITLLFSFLEPGGYINTGAWSIGNECVYYAFTPFLIVLYAKSTRLANYSVLIAIFIGLYFAFYKLDQSQDLSAQWSIYINPFNNLFFYVCGVMLYFNFHQTNITIYAPWLILLSVFVFIFFPVSGNQIQIVAGINRIVFSIASIILVFGVYKLEVNSVNWLAKTLGIFGRLTYGIYLLHPIAYMSIKIFWGISGFNCMILSVLITILMASASYKYYEIPFIKLGKKLTLSNRNDKKYMEVNR